MRFIKWAAISLLVLFVLIQVVRPAKTNPAVDESKVIAAHTQMTPEVAAILERSCNDCHSYKTQWPWYSNIAPVSWLLVSDVNDGRKNMLLSDWGSYDARKASRKLDEMCEQVEKGEMPLAPYLFLHPAAKLSDADKQTLCNWTKQESDRLRATQTTP